MAPEQPRAHPDRGRRPVAALFLLLTLGLLGYAILLGSYFEPTDDALEDAQTGRFLRLPAFIGVVGSVVGLAGGRRWWGAVGLVVAALGSVLCVVVLVVR